MSDNETISRIQIELEGDQQAVQGMARLQTQGESAKRTFSDMDRASSQAAQAVANIKLSSQAAADAKKLATGLDEVGTKAKDAVTSLDAMNRQAAAAAKSASATAGKGITGGGISGALSATAQIMPGPVGDIARTAASMNQLITPLSALGPAAIAGGVALGAVGLALNAYNNAVTQQTAALRAQTDLRLRLNAMTTDEINAEIRAAEAKMKANNARLDELRAGEQAINQNHDVAGALERMAVAAGKNLFPSLRAVGDEENRLADENSKLADQLKTLQGSLNDTATVANDAAKAFQEGQARQSDTLRQNAQDEKDMLGLYRTGTSSQVKARIAVLSDEQLATQHWIDALAGLSNRTEADEKQYADLIALRDRNIQRLQQLQAYILPLILARESEAAAAKQAEQAIKDFASGVAALAGGVAALGSLDKERAAALAKQADQDARDAQVSALEARIARSKEHDEQAAHQAKLQDLRKEAVQKERDLTGQFMAESLKALKDFQLSESRQTADYNLNRKRQMEDLYRDLTDLAAQRDVAGFIARQRQGNTDLARGAEDFGIGASRRAEDFARANEERRAQFEQQLTTQRDQAAAQLEVERQAGQQRVTETAKLEQELADLRAQWAAADKQAQRAQEQQAYNERRTQLGNALAVELNQVKNFVQGAQAWLGSLVNWTQRGAAYAEQIARPGRPAITANAEGGIYEKPTLGLLGERPGWSDFVVPVRRSEGFDQALNRFMGGHAGGRAPIIFQDQRSVTVGDIASRADVDAALAADRAELFEGLKMAISGVSGI